MQCINLPECSWEMMPVCEMEIIPKIRFDFMDAWKRKHSLTFLTIFYSCKKVQSQFLFIQQNYFYVFSLYYLNTLISSGLTHRLSRGGSGKLWTCFDWHINCKRHFKPLHHTHSFLLRIPSANLSSCTSGHHEEFVIAYFHITCKH